MRIDLQFFGGRGSGGGRRQESSAGSKATSRDIRDYFTDKRSKAVEGKDQDTLQLKGKDATNKPLRTMLENSGWVQESSIKNTWVYPKTEAGRTMLPKKSDEQIRSESQKLQELPAGSTITRMINGKPVDYMAHDVARTGRNGRMLRIRKYSVITSGNKNGTGITKDTTDPYYVAQGQWKLKKRKK